MAQASMEKASQVDGNYEEFKKLLPELMQTHAGKFAVMNDGKIVEFFDSFADAVRFGNSEFGASNFSVQEVTSKDINLGYYSYALCHAPN